MHSYNRPQTPEERAAAEALLATVRGSGDATDIVKNAG